MTRLRILIFLFSVFTFFSCSTDEEDPVELNEAEITGELSKWVKEYYTYYDYEIDGYGDNPILRAKYVYNIGDNRISSYDYFDYKPNGIDIQTHLTVVIEYENDLISSSTTTENEVLKNRTSFVYNEQGILSRVDYDSEVSSPRYTRYHYHYAINGIRVDIGRSTSNDGIDYTYSADNYLKYLKEFDSLDNQTSERILDPENPGGSNIDFDNHGNIINGEIYSGRGGTYFHQSYKYSENINTASSIILNTFGKRTYWLTDFIRHPDDWAHDLSPNTIAEITDLIYDVSIITENEFSDNDLLLSTRHTTFGTSTALEEIHHQFIYE